MHSPFPPSPAGSHAHLLQRQAPLPAWARPLGTPPPADGARAPLLVRLAETQLWAGDGASPPAWLVHRAEQVNDAAALGQIGHVALQVNPGYQRLLLHAVRILRGDAVIDHTAQVPVRLLQREAALEQGIESGVLTVTMVLADVRVGDTLELAYTVEGENPIFAGRYAGWAAWDLAHPVALRRVLLSAPAARRIAWRCLGDRPGPRPQPQETVDEQGLRRLAFEGRAQPGVGTEPGLPPDAQPLRWLQFSEFESWNEVARWAQRLFDDALRAPLPAALQPLLLQLRALPDADAQASHALQWVQREIRYHSLSLGEGSHRPHTPAEVVARRYGDCKDKSLLLVRLLRELGLPARPALVAARTRQGPLQMLPSPEAFDHVIVQLSPLAPLNGRAHWLDPTRLHQGGPLATLGQALEDAAALVVDPATAALDRIVSAERDTLFASSLHERYLLPQPGPQAVLETEQHWHGLAAEELWAHLQRMDAGELERWVLARYDRRHPGLLLLTPPQVRHDAGLNRLTVAARYRVPRAAAAGHGDWTLRYRAANLQGAFPVPDSLQRQLPLALPAYPGRLHYQVEVQWPDGTEPLELPHAERLETPHFALRMQRSVHGGAVRHSLTLQPYRDRVQAHELPHFVEDLQRMEALIGDRMTARDLRGSHLPAALPPAERRRAQLRAQAERSAKAIARGHLQGEDLASAHALRAQALAQLGDAEAAQQAAAHALSHGPAWAGSWLARAEVRWQAGDAAGAEADLGHALQLDADAWEAYWRRAWVRLARGRCEAAAADFDAAEREAHDDAQRRQARLWGEVALQRAGLAPLRDAAALPLTEPLPAADAAYLQAQRALCRGDADAARAACEQVPALALPGGPAAAAARVVLHTLQAAAPVPG